MAGIFNSNYRGGNRSEYLAHYLLSYLGSCTPVPRQEDVGVDFHCAVCESTAVGDCVKEQFYLQLKSSDGDDLDYGHVVRMKDGSLKWKYYEKDWLFSLDLPLFIGVCSKENRSIKIYSTSFIWHNYWTKEFATIRLLPNSPSDSNLEVQAVSDEILPHWDASLKCANRLVKTPLGPPLIEFSVDDVLDDQKLISYRTILQQAHGWEKSNLIYRNLNIPYFTWLLNIHTNKSMKAAYYFVTERAAKDEPSLLGSIVPIALSLGLLYKASDPMKFNLLKPFLSLLPKDRIPAEVVNRIPELK